MHGEFFVRLGYVALLDGAYDLNFVASIAEGVDELTECHGYAVDFRRIGFGNERDIHVLKGSCFWESEAWEIARITRSGKNACVTIALREGESGMRG